MNQPVSRLELMKIVVSVAVETYSPYYSLENFNAQWNNVTIRMLKEKCWSTDTENELLYFTVICTSRLYKTND